MTTVKPVDKYETHNAAFEISKLTSKVRVDDLQRQRADEQLIEDLTSTYFANEIPLDTKEDSINYFLSMCRRYDHVFQMLCARIPPKTLSQRQNLHAHAVTYALNPDFYGDGMVCLEYFISLQS
jgi:hypothetical protein